MSNCKLPERKKDVLKDLKSPRPTLFVEKLLGNESLSVRLDMQVDIVCCDRYLVVRR